MERLMASFNMDDYVPVADRIARWYDDNPDGRIVADPPQLLDVGGRYFIASTARAYRTPDDPCPSQGSAWEPYPGATSFTRDSEAQNAETSAVGRALALAGVEVKRGMASREEVQNRQVEPAAPANEIVALKDVLKSLPDFMQDDVKAWVKKGKKLETLTMIEVADAWRFVNACVGEAGLQETF